LEDLTMNALKHMELIFGAVLAVECVITLLPDELERPARTAAARAPAMQVVVVKARRMTALEKRHALEEDAGMRGVATGS
jgi:hypothetical protein